MKLAAAFWCWNLLMQMVQIILLFQTKRNKFFLAGVSSRCGHACVFSLMQQETTMQADEFAFRCLT